MSSMIPYTPYQIPSAQPDFSSLMTLGMPNTNVTGNALLEGAALPAGSGSVPGASPFDWSSFLFGSEGKGGAAQLGLGTMAGLTNLFMGMKQYGIAKDTLEENKRQFGLNYEAQKNLTNSQLADRQKARLAAAPGQFESEADYMMKYGVK